MKRLKVSSVSRRKKLGRGDAVGAAKLMKPRSELNPGVWQGDCMEFERCCLTRRRGGAEKHAENIFSGLVSVLARLRRKVKTGERGDSGDRTASQRRLTLGWKADQRSARRIPQLGLVHRGFGERAFCGVAQGPRRGIRGGENR